MRALLATLFGTMAALAMERMSPRMRAIFDGLFSAAIVVPGVVIGIATLVALVVAWLSLGLAPQGANQFQLLLNKQDALTEFDTLEPGRFQALRDGTRVTYTDTLEITTAHEG